MSRKNKLIAQTKKGALATAARKDAFLKAFAQLGTIKHAAKRAGINRFTHNDWLEKDPDYVDRFKEAQDNVRDKIERELIRRATIGETVVKYDKEGNIVSEYQQKSDVLLIFLAKGWMPEKYRERIDIQGKHQHLHAHVHRVEGEGLKSLPDSVVERILGTLPEASGGSGEAPGTAPSGA